MRGELRYTIIMAVLFCTAFNFSTILLSGIFSKYDEVISNDLDAHVHSKIKERAPDGSKFVQCMLHLEKEVMNQNQINAWDRDQVMIPTSVKIVDNRYWILGYGNGNVYYKCNGFDGAKVQRMNRKTRGLFALQCPSSVNPRNTTLTTLSSFDVTNKTNVQTYNMTVFDDCERKDIEETFVNKEIHVPRNTKVMKIGIAANFHQERRKAMEWAAYHHAIGVDHIWLYLNEDWDNARDLPQRDYVTWVPWNFHLSHDVRKQQWGGYIEFQAASQNDALYRAKRLGFDWLATIDIDEYLVLHNGKQAGTTKPLKEYFHSSLNESSVSYNSMQSIRLTSVPFGSNYGSDQKQIKELYIDHVYRRFIDVDDKEYIEKGRWKHFLNVKLATAINIHYIVGKFHDARASVLRINHYKSPEQYGVFQGMGNLTKETWFRDNFRSVIENEMKSIQYPNSTS